MTELGPDSVPRSNAPIIKFDVNEARQLVIVTMRELALRPEKDLADAVAAYCTRANIRDVIARCVVDVIAEVTREEVDRYYRKGEEREIVVRAILAVLDQRRGKDAEGT